MSVSPLQCFSSLRSVTSHKYRFLFLVQTLYSHWLIYSIYRSSYKFLAWFRIPLTANWLLCNVWDRLEFALSRDSCFSPFRLFVKNLFYKHRKALFLLLFILSGQCPPDSNPIGCYILFIVYILYCCLASRVAVEDTGATSDLVEFSHPSNTLSRTIIVSLARLSGVHLFSPEVDLRASERGQYSRGSSSLMDLNGYVTLSCVSPSLKLTQYLLAAGYWEQLQHGMRNLIDLGEIASDIERLAVFPQVRTGTNTGTDIPQFQLRFYV